MINVTGPYSQTGVPPPDEGPLGSVLALRASQLTTAAEPQLGSLARFLIVEPGDSLSAIEGEIGFSVLQNLVDGTRFTDPDFEPSWEWIEDHGDVFELVFILTDDGFAHVIFVLDQHGVDTDLLTLCRRYTRDAA